MMDRSVDSIGSCSLDVDADSSEMSDTSSSLHLLTPLSTKDITLADPNKSNCEVKTIITQPTCYATDSPVVVLGGSSGKKPSYLNLACCVNGYSSITTYDSKIRQDINNSREVSPIRPSSTSIQYCKRNSALAPPTKVAMPNINITTPSLCTTPMKGAASEVKYFEANNNYNQCSNGASNEKADENKKANSFIQQRVERLYGPGALAQAFYSPKKIKTCFGDRLEETSTTELSQKFQQLSPSKDYNEFTKKVNATKTSSALNSSKSLAAITNDNTENNAIDLPVLRHLSQEFRAQLPSISPKRSVLRSNTGKTSPHYSDKNYVNDTQKIGEPSIQSPEKDEIDHKAPDYNKIDISVSRDQKTHYDITCEKTEAKKVFEPVPEEHTQILSKNGTGRDGNYFLSLLKAEQNRLLALANKAEKYTDMLSNNPEVSEEIFGILRSASGKARLLVSQKMKQFEGLCHNNLNRSPEDNFPTTVEDLEGFWDMVNLQVDNINAIFDDIELLKENGWKKTLDEVVDSSPYKQQKQTKPIGSPKLKSTIKTTVNSNSKTSASALKREAQRKQLMELKKKHKMALAANSTTPLTEYESKTSNNTEQFKENRS